MDINLSGVRIFTVLKSIKNIYHKHRKDYLIPKIIILIFEIFMKTWNSGVVKDWIIMIQSPIPSSN